MSSQIVVNIKDASSSIVIPDTDVPETNTPDTGVFSVSHDNDVNVATGMVAPIIGVSILVLVLVVLVAKIVKNHKSKNTDRFSIHSEHRLMLRFMSVAVVVLLFSFAFLNYNEKSDTVNAQTTASDGLSITTEDINIDVELDDEPVFAMTKSTVKVDVATDSGYTLMAYVDSESSDLINETDTSSKSKISGLESSYSQVLTENTWGMALAEPEDQDTPVFRGLPIGQKEAITVKVTGSKATVANDATELYYATYVTPDLEEGTYTGATVNYVAVSNPTTDDDITVRYYTYDNNNEYELTNTVTYGLDCSIVYIGGNCRKAYAGELTTINAANGDIDVLPPFGRFENLEGSLNPIAYEGVDGLKIAVDYRGESDFYTVFLKGAYPTINSLIAKMQEIENAGGDPNDWIAGFFVPTMVNETEDSLKELYFSGDAFTIISIPFDDGNYSDFNYVVTPIFMNEPSDIDTTETTICGLAETNDANIVVWDAGSYFGMVRPISFPGADRLRVEVSYNFPSSENGDFKLITIEGNWSGVSKPIGHQIYSSDEDISRVDTFDYNGDTVTLYFDGAVNSSANINDYGFSAKVYPIYNDEIEDTMPTQTCRIVSKSGNYRDHKYGGDWFLEFGEDGELVRSEDDIKHILYVWYDTLRGRTIDAYEPK